MIIVKQENMPASERNSWDGKNISDLVSLLSEMSDAEKSEFVSPHESLIPTEITELCNEVRACDLRGYCLIGESADQIKPAWQILCPNASKIERPIVYHGAILVPMIKNTHLIGFVTHPSENYSATFTITKKGVQGHWNNFVQWSIQRSDRGEVLYVEENIRMEQALEDYIGKAKEMRLIQ